LFFVLPSGLPDNRPLTLGEPQIKPARTFYRRADILLSTLRHKRCRPSQIYSLINGALCVFYTLSAIRYTLYAISLYAIRSTPYVIRDTLHEIRFTKYDSRDTRYEYMQNKPNLLDNQMNVISVITKDYENIANFKLCEYKPNQTQFPQRDTRYAIRNTRYAIRDTIHAIRNTNPTCRGVASGEAGSNPILPLEISRSAVRTP